MNAPNDLSGSIESRYTGFSIGVDVDPAILIVKGRVDQHGFLADVHSMAVKLDELGRQLLSYRAFSVQ